MDEGFESTEIPPAESGLSKEVNGTSHTAISCSSKAAVPVVLRLVETGPVSLWLNRNSSESSQSRQSKREAPSEISGDIESTGIVNISRNASSSASDSQDGISGNSMFVMTASCSLCWRCLLDGVLQRGWDPSSTCQFEYKYLKATGYSDPGTTFCRRGESRALYIINEAALQVPVDPKRNHEVQKQGS